MNKTDEEIKELKQLFEQYTKHHVPVFEENDDYENAIEEDKWVFCFGTSCVTCEVSHLCDSVSRASTPFLSNEIYNEIKESNPEYFI